MHRSHRYAALVVLGAFLLAAWSAALFGQKDEAPKLFVNNTNVEVGDVLEGKDIEYIFHIRNHGKGELQIISVKPG
ncbi:MAG TPA: hypothetical protein ENO08_02050 [Candidatus Eisenbacteria bacterium]|uniref:DUF1573 domain-containing protein n=1 Tax=Eiseniibacteriota bacterium TaxID=2212470 RepID=A0A7V2ATZ5_UNCEI|nr:hypothetical protein [Candidatus Eisenbacteria bacterium]